MAEKQTTPDLMRMWNVDRKLRPDEKILKPIFCVGLMCIYFNFNSVFNCICCLTIEFIDLQIVKSYKTVIKLQVYVFISDDIKIVVQNLNIMFTTKKHFDIQTENLKKVNSLINLNQIKL